MNRNPEITHNVIGETVNMVTRVKNDLRFPDTPKEVVDSWVEVMPRMILFIVRHRLTFIAPEFSGNFIRIYEYLVRNPEKYTGSEDLYDEKMKELLTFPINSKVRDLNDIVDDLAKEIIDFRPNLFVFSMRPGSGKTKLFKMLREKLIGPHSGYRNIKIFERDAFRMKYAEHETVNKHWYGNVKKFINQNSDNLAFVGNCFENDFAMKFRQELGKQTKRRMMVARLTDEELLHPDYALTCMHRLSNRSSDNNDDSTLTMDLGAYVVCNKFFNSKPITKVSRKEAKEVKIVYFKTIDLEEPDPKSSDACWEFRKLFTVSKGPTLRKRMKFVENSANSVKKPILIGLYPTDTDFIFKLFDLASDKLEKSDMHVTLKFRPSEEDISKIDNKPVTLVGKEIITIEKNGEMLQFIPLGTPEHPDYHVTLGTTNNKVLPCADSGNYLREQENLGFSKDPTKFSVENGYKVSTQSIECIEYVGTQKLFY